MDIETSAAIGQVGERINALEQSLRVEFRDRFAENRRHAEGLFEQSIRHTDGRFGTLRDEMQVIRNDVQILRGDVQGLRSDVQILRDDVRVLRDDVSIVRDDVRILADGFATVSGELADHRRHTQVLVEAVRDDVRMLAEDFAHVSSKLDSLKR